LGGKGKKRVTNAIGQEKNALKNGADGGGNRNAKKRQQRSREKGIATSGEGN